MLSLKKEISWEEKSQEKILPPEKLEAFARKIREEKKSLATLNGSFDLLHAGHLHILFEASKQADILLVALNTDQSIQRYKGSNRPIVPLRYRLEMMAAIAFVDYVTWFDEGTPCSLLEKLSPSVHVNGSEYGIDCIEAPTVKKQGGKIYIVEKIEGLSTSAIIEKIKKCEI